jgi:hypothetical protein
MRMRTRFTYILTLVLTTLTAFIKEECKGLTDGRYKISYRTDGYKKADFELIINGTNYTIIENDRQSKRGRIKWLGQCSFSLQVDSIITPSRVDTSRSISNDAKSSMARALRSLEQQRDPSILLSDGITYYELEKRSGKKYYFRLTSTARPHITIAEGRLVRLGN